MSVSSATSYTELREIGSGTFGIARLVRNENTGNTYISKEVDTTEMSEIERAQAFKEVSILRALHHPNIVKYQAFEKSDSSFSLIMEYADGGELFDAI